jgi:hypothetical protein
VQVSLPSLSKELTMPNAPMPPTSARGLCPHAEHLITTPEYSHAAPVASCAVVCNGTAHFGPFLGSSMRRALTWRLRAVCNRNSVSVLLSHQCTQDGHRSALIHDRTDRLGKLQCGRGCAIPDVGSGRLGFLPRPIAFERRRGGVLEGNVEASAGVPVLSMLMGTSSSGILTMPGSGG